MALPVIQYGRVKPKVQECALYILYILCAWGISCWPFSGKYCRSRKRKAAKFIILSKDCLQNRSRDNCLLDKTTGGQRAAWYSCLNASFIIQADDQRVSWVMFSKCVHQQFTYDICTYMEVHINFDSSKLKLAPQFTNLDCNTLRFQIQESNPVAKFIVSDWGDKVNSGIGLSYRPARLHWLADCATNLCRSQLYPPVRDYEFGYRSHWYRKQSGPCLILSNYNSKETNSVQLLLLFFHDRAYFSLYFFKRTI